MVTSQPLLDQQNKTIIIIIWGSIWDSIWHFGNTLLRLLGSNLNLKLKSLKSRNYRHGRYTKTHIHINQIIIIQIQICCLPNPNKFMPSFFYLASDFHRITPRLLRTVTFLSLIFKMKGSDDVLPEIPTSKTSYLLQCFMILIRKDQDNHDIYPIKTHS